MNTITIEAMKLEQLTALAETVVNGLDEIVMDCNNLKTANRIQGIASLLVDLLEEVAA